MRRGSNSFATLDLIFHNEESLLFSNMKKSTFRLCNQNANTYWYFCAKSHHYMYVKRQLSDGKSRLSPKRDLAKLNRGSMECSGFTKHGGDDEIATITEEKRPQQTRKDASYLRYTLNQINMFYIPWCWIALCGKRKAMSDLYSRRTLSTIKFPFATGRGSEHGKYTCYNQEYQHDNNDEQQEFKRLKLWFREILYKNT